MTDINPRLGGYMVFQRIKESEWRVVGDVARRPGLPARRSRGQAIKDVLGREPLHNETFAVLPLSEWRVALDQ